MTGLAIAVGADRRNAPDSEVSSPLVTPRLDEAWIAAAALLAGAIIATAGALLGNLMSRKTANATIKANSADIKAQLEAVSADVRAQVEAASAATAAQIEADRRNRLGEKQAAAYIDGIKAIRHQQTIRASQVRNIITGSDPLTTAPPADGADSEAQMIAYGSPAVIGKLRARVAAGTQFVNSWRILDQMPPGAARVDMAEQARREAGVADGLDDELLDTIRAELHAGTDRAPDPPVPLAASAQASGGPPTP